MVFDPTTGDVVLFGGNCSCAPLLDDTWTWNGSTWTDVQPSNSPPGLQNAPFVYDKALGMAVLFDAGGDAWLWSGSNWTEETTNVPLNLSSGASAAYDDTAGDVVAVTGGQTWTWNSGGWTQQHPTSSPSAREFASMAFDESTGTVLLYGGRIPGAPTADQYPGDTWTWNESNWVEDHPASSPPARSNASMSFDLATNSMVLFGGETLYNITMGDTWAWDGSSWTNQNPTTAPGGRNSAGMAYDAVNGNLLLFSGAYAIGDTWVFSVTSWKGSNPTTQPPPRAESAMAYDSANSTVVMYGGIADNATYLGDTWLWNGTNWENATPSAPGSSPPGAAWCFHGVDPATGDAVLFGGDASGVTNQTWTWNGSTWTEEFPTTSPSPRMDSSMAYDPVTGDIVLFGGENSAMAGLSDTWLWNGSDWTEALTTGPAGRLDVPMAYDKATGEVVLFGGETAITNAGSLLDDTWDWTGSGWTEQSPSSSPPPLCRRIDDLRLGDRQHAALRGVDRVPGQWTDQLSLGLEWSELDASEPHHESSGQTRRVDDVRRIKESNRSVRRRPRFVGGDRSASWTISRRHLDLFHAGATIRARYHVGHDFGPVRDGRLVRTKGLG